MSCAFASGCVCPERVGVLRWESFVGLRCPVVGPGCAGVVTLECVRRYQCVFVCLGVGVAPPTSLEWVTEATAVYLPASPARRAQGL